MIDSSSPHPPDDASASATLIRVLLAYRSSIVLATAVRLGIPDLLAQRPMSSQEIADNLGADPSSLDRMLLLLLSQGIFDLDGARYRLNSLSRLLRTDEPGGLRDIVLFFSSEDNLASWCDFQRTVLSGEPAFDRLYGMNRFVYLDSHPEVAEVFSAGMANINRLVGPSILRSYDFSRHRRLMDLGGGRGDFTIQLLRAHPHLRAVVLDTPPVVAEAARQVESAGLADRCEVIGGDFFQAVPEGADLLVLKGVVNSFPDNRVLTLLQNCRRVMQAGSRLLIIDGITPSQEEIARTGDRDPLLLQVLMWDLNMMVMNGGRQRTARDLDGLLRQSNLALERILPTGTYVSLVECSPC